MDWFDQVQDTDREIAQAMARETIRQNEHLELIASENFVSPAVIQAAGSVFTNKYAEGYPGKRYYGGCGPTDEVEELARNRAKSLFGADHANVQPHSGSQANMAVYMALLDHGDTILGLSLDHGGHLTHGHRLSFSGKYFNIAAYQVDKETERLDYENLAQLAKDTKPKLIVAGASAYPRTLDFERMGQIAKDCGALLMVDMAHIAGLVAADIHPSPVPHADVVTSTTHKTLRGPRGGLILCKEEHAKAIDRAVFPGVQGGPLVHIMAAKAVAFKEAATPLFRMYQKSLVANARVLCRTMADEGIRIVSGGTDTHLFLADVTPVGLNGRDAERLLERANITVNKNTIPFDQNPPMKASGIRVGTPAVTSRGMAEEEMGQIGKMMARLLNKGDDPHLAESIKGEVLSLCAQFPLYPEALAQAKSLLQG